MWSGGGARPQFVEQPHVLDRDHRLIGKIRDQLNLLAAERSDFLAVDAEQGEADFKMSFRPPSGAPRAPQSVLLRRQYPELSQHERAVKISPLPCQAIVLVEGKDGTKWKLNPASGGRNPIP
jgi:hypothetical protein